MAEAIVVIASHPDDEVLGCGGTLARFAAAGSEVHVLFLADGETSRGSDTTSLAAKKQVEMRKEAAACACAILGCTSQSSLSLPDNRLDGIDLLDVVKPIERFLSEHRPAVVMTHHAGDVNVDHRVAHHAVVTACRPQPGHEVNELLFFEVPSSTEWSPPGSSRAFTPNWFVDISATLPRKLDALRAYNAELRPFPHPRSISAIEALSAWRGASAGVPAAEAFMLGRKIVR